MAAGRQGARLSALHGVPAPGCHKGGQQPWGSRPQDQRDSAAGKCLQSKDSSWRSQKKHRRPVRGERPGASARPWVTRAQQLQADRREGPAGPALTPTGSAGALPPPAHPPSVQWRRPQRTQLAPGSRGHGSDTTGPPSVCPGSNWVVTNVSVLHLSGQKISRVLIYNRFLSPAPPPRS